MINNIMSNRTMPKAREHLPFLTQLEPVLPLRNLR